MKIGVLVSTAVAFAASQAAAVPVQWTSGSGGNDHYYEFISSPVPIDFAAADAAASASSHVGLTGHLVTITSAAEQAFVDSLPGNSGEFWIGASDAASEGTWEWIRGPEAGTLLSAGFTNWASGEPNNFVGVEDYAVGNWFGNAWNDVSAGSEFSAYVVEYSAAPAVPLPAGLPLLMTAFGAVALLRRKTS